MCGIAPSLLEADYRQLGRELLRIERAGAEYVHLDIMDGNFVPNLSFGIKMIRGLRDSTNLIFDVHMMVCEPIRFIPQLKEAGADHVTVHIEACEQVRETLEEIRYCGMKAGIALNPESDEGMLTKEVLQAADIVHVMTVYPGREGEMFIPASLKKIRNIRKMLEDYRMEKPIETDGNIGFDNVEEVVDAGADIIVSGKAVFHGNLEKNIQRMREMVQHGRKR